MRIHHPQVLMEHDLDTVVLVEQGVVVLALLALHPALAGVVIEGTAWRGPRFREHRLTPDTKCGPNQQNSEF